MRKNDVCKQQARVRKELGLVVFCLRVYYSLRFVVGYACAYEEGGNGDGSCEVGPTP